MNYTFIFDAEQTDLVETAVVPLIQDIVSKTIALGTEEPELVAGDHVLMYLSDQQIKKLLPLIQEKEISVYALPHPKAK